MNENEAIKKYESGEITREELSRYYKTTSIWERNLHNNSVYNALNEEKSLLAGLNK